RGPSVRALARGLVAPRLIATYAVGFCTLFSLVALFTYAGFYLGAPPFSLGPGAIGSLFTVYLVGAVVTPVAGRWVDRIGARRVLAWSFGAGSVGAMLTLIPSFAVVLAGLAIAASGVFVAQVAATSYLRTAATPVLRSLASGVFITCYYLGGAIAGVAPGLLWALAGWAGTVALAVIAQSAAIAVSARAWLEPTAVPPVAVARGVGVELAPDACACSSDARDMADSPDVVTHGRARGARAHIDGGGRARAARVSRGGEDAARGRRVRARHGDRRQA
ncbi:MAG TPA: MFS transporter, partial [Kofleriaceae bacterium]